MAEKAKKIFGGLLAVLLVLAIAVVCIFLFWLGPTVKSVAQHIGSKALGTPLTINELKINPRHGTVHMSGFAIANHAGFDRTNAVSLASMDITLDTGSVFSPTVLVHRVRIESPHFVYEQNKAGDNIAEFIRNIETFIGKDPDRKSTIKDEGDSEAKAVVVKQLEINDIQFHLANTESPELDIDIGIEQIAASMTNGTVRLKNLHVGNPATLETPNLFTLDGIDILVDPASIYSGTVSLRDVQVARPCAYLEINPETDTAAEFMTIAENLARFMTNSATTAVSGSPASPKEAPETALPVQLHNLDIDDIQVRLLDTTAANAPAQPSMLAGIGSISVKLVDGAIQIKGIRVPNPAGYQSTNLFHLANINISIDPDSLLSGRINVEKVWINSPEINLEQTETSGNFAELQTTLMGFVPPEGTVEGAPVPEAVAQPGEWPEPIPLDKQPVVVHELAVTNFAINLKMPVVTNEPSWSIGAEDLAKLNPLKKLSLDKLNPLEKLKLDKLNLLAGGDEEEEPETDSDAPMTLVAFKNLSIQPLEGLIDLDRLRIANPPGFTRRDLARIDELHCELDPDSLQTDTLVIKDLVISKPRVRYERQILTDNIKALQKEIEQATGDQEEKPAKQQNKSDRTETGESAEGDDGQKVIIDRVIIAKGSVQAKLSIAPATPPIPLIKITLKDIGKEKGGATPAEASTKVFDSFYDTMISSIGEKTGFAGDALKGFGALTIGALPGMGDGDEAVQPEEPDMQDIVEEVVKPAVEPEKPGQKRRKRRLPGRTF